MRICTVCGKEKVLSDFNKGKAFCRVCQSEKKKEYLSGSGKMVAALYGKVYRALHPEQRKTEKKQYREKHAERLNRQSRERYAEDPEKARFWEKQWRQRYPEKNVVKCQNRRALRDGSDGKFTSKEWQDLCRKYGNRCLMCGKENVKLSPDHVLPLSKGGSNTIDNIQPLCVSCNSSKGARYIDYRQRATTVLSGDRR